MMPSIFLSHGSPMLPLTAAPARDFLAGFAATLPRPTAIVVASAHWETTGPAVNAVASNETIYDFGGFPRELYQLTYPAPGDAPLAHRIQTMLQEAGLRCDIDTRRGLDHGAWCPLYIAYPDADIPVLEVSVQTHLGTAHHVRLGAALAPLRAEGVLVIGSGSWTHDLRRFRGQAMDAPEPPDVIAFSDWMDRALVENRREDLLDYRRLAPYAAAEHPTEEHLLPLYVALGAAGAAAKATRIHTSASYGILRMDAYSFA
jgi:4,5-DOPA dioxygenase extradiol